MQQKQAGQETADGERIEELEIERRRSEALEFERR